MKLLKYIIFVIMTFFLSCAVSKGIPFDINGVSKIELYKSTKKEVVSIFGEPYKRITDVEKGFENEFLYYYDKNNNQYDLLVLKFDENDVIIYYRTESGNIGSSNVLIETY